MDSIRRGPDRIAIRRCHVCGLARVVRVTVRVRVTRTGILHIRAVAPPDSLVVLEACTSVATLESGVGGLQAKENAIVAPNENTISRERAASEKAGSVRRRRFEIPKLLLATGFKAVENVAVGIAVQVFVARVVGDLA